MYIQPTVGAILQIEQWIGKDSNRCGNVLGVNVPTRPSSYTPFLLSIFHCQGAVTLEVPNLPFTDLD